MNQRDKSIVLGIIEALNADPEWSADTLDAITAVLVSQGVTVSYDPDGNVWFEYA